MSEDERLAALQRAIAHFNDLSAHEQYFDLYAEGAVFHGYPPGAERLDGAKQFYRQAWDANPGWLLAITGVDDVGESLRVRFTYGPHEGVTTLRFEGDKVVERWQGAVAQPHSPRRRPRNRSVPRQSPAAALR